MISQLSKKTSPERIKSQEPQPNANLESSQNQILKNPESIVQELGDNISFLAGETKQSIDIHLNTTYLIEDEIAKIYRIIKEGIVNREIVDMKFLSKFLPLEIQDKPDEITALYDNIRKILPDDFDITQINIQPLLLSCNDRLVAIFFLKVLNYYYPNLHWFRGGELVIRQGTVVLDQPGSDGYLGNATQAARYAIRTFDGRPRPNGGVLAISLKDIIDGIEKRIIRTYYHHTIDMSLIRQDAGGSTTIDDYYQWAKAAIKFIPVSNWEDANSLNKILRQKSIKLN